MPDHALTKFSRQWSGPWRRGRVCCVRCGRCRTKTRKHHSSSAPQRAKDGLRGDTGGGDGPRDRGTNPQMHLGEVHAGCAAAVRAWRGRPSWVDGKPLAVGCKAVFTAASGNVTHFGSIVSNASRTPRLR